MTSKSSADIKKVIETSFGDLVIANSEIRINKFNGKISEYAIEWLEEYEEKANLKNWNNEKKFKHFNQFLSKNAKEWYKLNFKILPNPPATWQGLKDAFNDYFIPKDRENYLRERMINRKHLNEEIIHYITSKRVYCIEFDPNMTFNAMKNYIIEGMNSKIKVTIVHKENNNMEQLENNAMNIEKGLIMSGDYSITNQGIDSRLDKLEKKIIKLTKAIQDIVFDEPQEVEHKYNYSNDTNDDYKLAHKQVNNITVNKRRSKCYICHIRGHKAKECPKKNENNNLIISDDHSSIGYEESVASEIIY
jgi:hypothetical protein